MLNGLAAAGPFAGQPHLLTWLALVVGVVAVVLGHRCLSTSSRHPVPWPRRQIIQFAGAAVVSAVALTWPLDDLAAHW